MPLLLRDGQVVEVSLRGVQVHVLHTGRFERQTVPPIDGGITQLPLPPLAAGGRDGGGRGVADGQGRQGGGGARGGDIEQLRFSVLTLRLAGRKPVKVVELMFYTLYLHGTLVYSQGS